MAALTDLTIAEAGAGLDKRDFTARELTDAYLVAMESARDLNAYIEETPERAQA
ncbi:MAG: Asp-tRNA(Asn)/Glu-tRNA(Gln) amidotransferase subunit GatA, partial [Alphaproteobacteria bacterium]